MGQPPANHQSTQSNIGVGKGSIISAGCRAPRLLWRARFCAEARATTALASLDGVPFTCGDAEAGNHLVHKPLTSPFSTEHSL